MGRKLPVKDAMFRRIWKGGDKPEDHWIWCGSMSQSTGQESFSVPQIRNHSGKAYLHARKHLLETLNLPLPEGKFLIAACGEQRCMRPEHFIGTNRLPRLADRKDVLEIGAEVDVARRKAIIAEHRRGIRLATYVKKRFSLEAIGSRFDLTRERIRQIVRLYDGETGIMRLHDVLPSGGGITPDWMSEESEDAAKD